MTHTCENIKAQLVDMKGKGLSDKAKLVALLEACGMTDLEALQDILECKPSTLRDARRALKIQRQNSVTDGNPAPEIRHADGNPSPSDGNPAQTTEFQRQNSVEPSRVDNIIINTIGEDTGESIVITPCIPQAADEPVAEPVIAKPKANRQRGTRLDREWELPADWRMWARTNFPASTDEQVTSQADQFRDYWIAKPGAIACKLDWEATWRNWCRKGLSAAGMVRQPQHTGSFSQPQTKQTDPNLVRKVWAKMQAEGLVQ